jgi:hypothetical protein
VADVYQNAERNAVHIQDYRVWAEIRYLDSPSDYREYLPGSGVQPIAQLANLVMLDANRSASAYLARLALLGIGLILFLISGYLLHVLVDGL